MSDPVEAATGQVAKDIAEKIDNSIYNAISSSQSPYGQNVWQTFPSTTTTSPWSHPLSGNVHFTNTSPLRQFTELEIDINQLQILEGDINVFIKCVAGTHHFIKTKGYVVCTCGSIVFKRLDALEGLVSDEQPIPGKSLPTKADRESPEIEQAVNEAIEVLETYDTMRKDIVGSR